MLALLTGVVVTAWACGPFFPRWLLSEAEQSVQAVPVGSFFREIAAWRQGATSRFKTLPPKDDQSRAQQVADAETVELTEALGKLGIAGERLEEVVQANAGFRARLQDYADALAAWQEEPYGWERNVLNPRPVFPEAVTPAGLPAEFADYARGCVAYYAGKTNEAHLAWSALLNRPEAERRYRSVWAAYMLGRMHVEALPEAAVGYFQKTRELAQAGYADSLGLAAASLGWEARAWLLQHDHRQAIHLYLEQLAGGEKETAMISLRRTVERAFGHSDAAVRKLAGDAACRRVVTAALISQPGWMTPLVGPQVADATQIWLRVLEEQGATEVELAEQLALAAYQGGKFEQAERWANRAPENSSVARWVQAKLLLRAGKMEPAAEKLARLVRDFPVVEEEQENPTDLLDRLTVSKESEGYDGITPGRQEIHGELGVLQLSRRDFVSSLDCLYRGKFWLDAAYVAERVLTVEELKTYVDRHWPSRPAREKGEEEFEGAERDGFRRLLARRLARLDRWAEARPYFPKAMWPLLEERQRLMATGGNLKLSAQVRATALWKAAQFTYQHGEELFYTSVEPDWGGGNYYETGPSVEARWQQQTNTVVVTSREELKRAAAHEVAPRIRRHYLFLAADLAWQAAELMPDQSEATAKVLHEAGGWIKYRDPKSANRFYRALVLRCGKTDLGRIAGQLRWFPPLDDDGQPYVPKREPRAKVEDTVDSFPVF